MCSTRARRAKLEAAGATMNGRLWIGALFVLSTAAANVLQKKAMASALGNDAGMSLAVVKRLLATPYLWGGLAAYAVALAMYLVLLSRVPLNVATSVAALNFVAVLLAARFVLGEPIPPLRYVGFACIIAGLFIVSRTQA
jgi:undecaprenyl phosphate-alpha-L-ara4N flippase subunit ArnE